MADENDGSVRAVVDAAFAVAGEGGWKSVTMAAIAARAGISLAQVYAVLPNKHAVLARLSDQVTRTVLAQAPSGSTELPRERLFEVLMARLDALAPYKAGLRSIAGEVPRDPAAAALLAMLVPPAMAWMLEAAGIPARDFGAPARVVGLSAVWTRVLRVWLRDDSEEGGKTMAELDRQLKRAESWANTLRLNDTT